MGQSQSWMLVSPIFSLFDLGNYGIKEWLQLAAAIIGIVVAIVGAWKTWRYSKSQIVARLFEYLEDQETTIKDARNRIIRQLKWGEPLGKEVEHDLYRDVARALSELANGDSTQAERTLATFADGLAKDIKLGRKYLFNANLQLATVQLVRGKSANARSEREAARAAWTSALECNPDDAEAARYLGELELAVGAADAAWELFAKAVDLAPDDKLLLAETSELKANFYRARGSPKNELTALNRSAPAFVDSGSHDRAAAAYARAGEVAADLGQTVQAPRLLRHAFENYSLAGNRNDMRAAREALEALGEDVSDLPPVDQAPVPHIPWRWIRLALELSILAAAGVLFYFTLR